MASIITATTTSGLTQSADNSGVLQLASGVGNLVTVPAVTGTAMVSGNMPAFSAYSSGGQSISVSSFTKITLNNEIFDTASAFDSTTNYRFTPQVAGYYQINGQVFFTGAATGFAQAAIYKNGTRYNYGSSASNNTSIGSQCVIADLIYFNGSTDYVELYGWQNSAGSLNTFTAGNFLSGCLVRTA
jgi:hypothetical protein